MIEIKNLNKSFGNKTLFKDFNLVIEKGQFVIFSGVSGCGKTTLLNMIGALEKIDSGEILINHVDISKKKNQLDFFSKEVGFLFQNFALIEDKTVLQNLNIIKRKNRSTISIEDALTKVGLLDTLNKKVYSLSGGEQQRVALARLMIKKCNLILADEPTGSLDKKNAEAVMKILSDMNNEGKTIIMVTHNEEIKNSRKKVVEL